MAERKPIVTNPSTIRKDIPVIKKPTTLNTRDTLNSKKVHLPLFERENYMWMGIGLVIVALGMILMSGGKSPNANQFNYKEVYSTTRVTIAPILILLGFATEIYAIFKRPKAHQ